MKHKIPKGMKIIKYIDGEYKISGEFLFYMWDTHGIPPKATGKMVNDRYGANYFKSN